MKKTNRSLLSIIALLVLSLSACASLAGVSHQAQGSLQPAASLSQPAAGLQKSTPAAVIPNTSSNDLLAAYESTLETIYNQVGPSVVSIRVVEEAQASAADAQLNPFFGSPFQQDIPNTPQIQQGLGSGFVWDQQGHIVTNNHVVENASKIEVTFADGTIVPAQLVGTDPHSDLAVIKVNVDAGQLIPVHLADSTQIKVGQLAIAIGNPFGEQGTMTTGIVSALGRSISATESQALGPGYSIPDIIQTDAPINPGNSGGVLVDDHGQVIGVTAAIESPVQASSGIGFAIPASIVQKVVPALIQDGKYDHPYLGISGTTLNPDLVKAMKLPDGTHGALIATVQPGGPAEKAGLHGSDRQATIDGQDVLVGGDVITGIDGQPVNSMDELIAYLFNKTEVGQTIKLSILRNGKTREISVKLQARPDQSAATSASDRTPTNNTWLGIRGITLTPSIAKEMSLPESIHEGVLVEQIELGSPADEAGLVGSTKPVIVAGSQILIGGDVITAFDGRAVNTVQDLARLLSEASSGDHVTLTVQRGDKTIQVPVTLGARSTQ